MAGKIIADQIEHSTAGSLDTQYVVNGSAKAHVRFIGAGTVAISGYSLNVSSVTDFGTGNYEAVLINSLAANEGVHFRTSNNKQTGDASTGAANKMPIFTENSNGTASDSNRCYCSVYGDLA